ncbi:MAG TPA: histidine--tRNA ligase [Candidatus Thermoplasmatota archaeon]|nr:histidine--tRNA ligase [Candidatus Thermoplasmatota archaeon]
MQDHAGRRVAEAPPINRPRGTRDFDPAQTAVRHHVGAQMRSVFRRFAYREVQTPAFEELALFTAKSGEGVIGELYSFKDKGDRDMCLRPELTAPVMRMYFQEHFNDPKPIKWFYHGACYRYDRPQAGRYREFWQFGCEQIGAGTPLAYAELLALADAVMREVGLQERDFFVGHVKILKHCVDAFGFDPDARGKLMRAIDKGDRAEAQRLADAKGGCGAALDRLFLVMDAPTVAAARHALLLGEVADPPGEDAELLADLRDLEACLGHLAAFGVANVRLNLGIARGLDYYTGIVFEMHCPILGAEKQLLGGGGYDLSHVFGGQATPTMGFGLGFDRTIVALEKQAELAGKAMAFPREVGPALYVAALGDAAARRMLPLVAQLRRQGIEVELDLLGRKPGAVAKHADAIGARRLAIVGDRDLESGTVQVKELATGKVEPIGLDAFASSAW